MFGTIIFNGVYAIALFMLHAELMTAGITLRVTASMSQFWSDTCCDTSPCEETNDHVIDAVFVDDECILLVDDTPAVLDQAIAIVIKVLLRIFISFVWL